MALLCFSGACCVVVRGGGQCDVYYVIICLEIDEISNKQNSAVLLKYL